MYNVDPSLINFIIFVLAIFVGYFVVWSVTPALHTPLNECYKCYFRNYNSRKPYTSMFGK